MVAISNQKTLNLFHDLYQQAGEMEHDGSGDMLSKFGFTFGTEDEPNSYIKRTPTGSLQVMFLPDNKYFVRKHTSGKQMGQFDWLNGIGELFDWLQDNAK